MSDTGQIIKELISEKMTLRELYDLKVDTQGRFDFEVHNSGTYAICRYRDYSRDKDGHRYRDAVPGTEELTADKKPFALDELQEVLIEIII